MTFRTRFRSHRAAMMLAGVMLTASACNLAGTTTIEAIDSAHLDSAMSEAVAHEAVIVAPTAAETAIVGDPVASVGVAEPAVPTPTAVPVRAEEAADATATVEGEPVATADDEATEIVDTSDATEAVDVTAEPSAEQDAEVETVQANVSAACGAGAYHVDPASLSDAYSVLLGGASLGANFESAMVTPTGGSIELIINGDQATVTFGGFTLDMAVTVPGSDTFTGTIVVNGAGNGQLVDGALSITAGVADAVVNLASDFGPISEAVSLPISGSWPIVCDGSSISVGNAVGGSETARFVRS